jgi:putative (di)nucleoside polyphosphate hydrolase
MPRQKSFSYIIRTNQAGPELLVFDSHEEPGLEVPKGSAQPGETPAQAALREVEEESGLTGLALITELGVTFWQGEEQHFFLFRADMPLPDRFDHVVTGQDGDRGMRYQYQWMAVTPALGQLLVQGSNRFVRELLAALEQEPVRKPRRRRTLRATPSGRRLASGVGRKME